MKLETPIHTTSNKLSSCTVAVLSILVDLSISGITVIDFSYRRGDDIYHPVWCLWKHPCHSSVYQTQMPSKQNHSAADESGCE